MTHQAKATDSTVDRDPPMDGTRQPENLYLALDKAAPIGAARLMPATGGLGVGIVTLVQTETECWPIAASDNAFAFQIVAPK